MTQHHCKKVAALFKFELLSSSHLPPSLLPFLFFFIFLTFFVFFFPSLCPSFSSLSLSPPTFFLFHFFLPYIIELILTWINFPIHCAAQPHKCCQDQFESINIGLCWHQLHNWVNNCIPISARDRERKRGTFHSLVINTLILEWSLLLTDRLFSDKLMV